MKILQLSLLTAWLPVFVFGLPTKLWAWGERGHQTVTKVAVRLVALKAKEEDAEFASLLGRKEQMLAHLSNVPDIVWRGQEAEIAQQNAPTHYLDLEFLLVGETKPRLSHMPKTLAAYRQAIEATCKQVPEDCAPGHSMDEKIAKTGHAPFRALQLFDGMQEALRMVKQQDLTAKQKVEKVNEALVFAGLASHFIGDLGNPSHTTKNYDGQLSGQRGLHSYFETQVVSAYDLQLNHFVFEYARRSRPFERLILAQKPIDRLDRIWALTLNSFLQLPKLMNLDERHSLTIRGDAILPAQRKPAIAVKQEFKGLAVERLALAADTLAEMWLEVWRQSGRPSLAGYSSYEYALSPQYIQAHYLDELD